MFRSRLFVVWLCCMLVLWTGLPQRSDQTCDGGGDWSASEVGSSPARSCCGADCHCRDRDGGAGACDCGSRAPERPPVAPAPHTEQVALPEAEAAPERPVVAPSATLELSTGSTLPIGLLPRVSRQKALSVWNC